MTSMCDKPIPEMLASDVARFWSHVDVKSPTECWEWKASKFAGGYGQLKIGGRTVKAHRVAFRLFHGYDPVGLMVRHTCDNPPCCNGLHLIDGTGADNQADCIERGRNNPARGSRHGSKTHPERWARGERVAGAKLTANQVSEVRSLYASGRFTQQQIGDRFGVSREAIGVIVRGERWAHLASDPASASAVSKINRGRPGESHRTAKLTTDAVRLIRSKYAAGGISQRQLADEFGVKPETISFVIRRITWKHVD